MQPEQIESFAKRIPVFLQLGFRQDAFAGLKSYLDLLWTSNLELNLISRKMSYDELLDNHVIDSLLPLKHFPKHSKRVVDFGSGGGLPAVIYALQFPEARFRLFEKSPRKQGFLNECKSLAPNLEILGEIQPELIEADVVMARAFKPIDVILEMSRSYCLQGGAYFLLKGRREKIEEEIGLAKKKFKSIEPAVLPLISPVLEVERHLVTIAL